MHWVWSMQLWCNYDAIITIFLIYNCCPIYLNRPLMPFDVVAWHVYKLNTIIIYLTIHNHISELFIKSILTLPCVRVKYGIWSMLTTNKFDMSTSTALEVPRVILKDWVPNVLSLNCTENYLNLTFSWFINYHMFLSKMIEYDHLNL